jgi:hypothetical protein
VEPLRSKAGWLRIGKLCVVTPAYTREYLLLSAMTDDGVEIHSETVERLMRVPAKATPHHQVQLPEGALDAQQEAQQRSVLNLVERQNADWLDKENEKLDAYADDLEKAFGAETKALEAEIRDARKALRGSNLALAEKLAEKRRISSLEAKRDKLKADFFDRRAALRAEVESMLDKIQESLRIQPSLVPLFTARWEVR